MGYQIAYLNMYGNAGVLADEIRTILAGARWFGLADEAPRHLCHHPSLSAVRNFDCIIVLERGRIIERGFHGQLMEEKGQYYQLYTGSAIA